MTFYGGFHSTLMAYKREFRFTGVIEYQAWLALYQGLIVFEFKDVLRRNLFFILTTSAAVCTDLERLYFSLENEVKVCQLNEISPV